MRLGALLLAMVIALANTPQAAAAGVPWQVPPVSPLKVAYAIDQDSSQTRLTEHQVADLPGSEDPTKAVVNPAAVKRYAYSSTTACPGAHPDRPDTANLPCLSAVLACQPPGPAGPLTWIWRQTTLGGAVTQGWTIVASTCARNAAPAARPTLTLAMIRDALHRTPWATLTAGIQPVGNTTLVTLPVYFQANWSATGFEPGESESIDPGLMLGYRVDIRPRLIGYTYHFGDATSFGPTPDPGGTYPNGAITHPYPSAGTYTTRIDATVSADFRISGGPWAPIPDTVTLSGTPTDITVRTARAVLVN